MVLGYSILARDSIRLLVFLMCSIDVLSVLLVHSRRSCIPHKGLTLYVVRPNVWLLGLSGKSRVD
jgi:hypothetical protein